MYSVPFLWLNKMYMYPCFMDLFSGFFSGLLRHSVPRKDVGNYGIIWNDLYRAM